MSEAPALSRLEPGKIGPGRLVLVVGPSGAGKDTLINLVREECADDERIVFPRRLVTREASSAEDNEYLTETAFREALAKGRFAAHWEAHGHCYALPRRIEDEIRAGRTVVVNVSRGVVDTLRNGYADLIVVAITAPPEILAERLAARARDSDGPIELRLRRSVDEIGKPDVTIVNVGEPTQHARPLLRVIRGELPARDENR